MGGVDMAGRGALFAITDEDRQALESSNSDEERIEYVYETIEERWEEPFLVETDKAWDPIHRCLSEWPPDTPWFHEVAPEHGAHALPEDHGTVPLKLCILGGRKLNDDERECFLRLVEPEQVEALVPALDAIDRETLREKYFRHCKGAWPEYGEEHFEYAWAYFEEVRDFYRRMAGNGRAVIFTADQ
jgi:hypothetical protein